jgi:hypothetical protein
VGGCYDEQITPHLLTAVANDDAGRRMLNELAIVNSN